MFSWVLDRHEEGCHEKKSIFTCVLVCTGLSNDDVGVVARGTVFQDIRPGAGFKTGDFVKEKFGGGGGVPYRTTRGWRGSLTQHRLNVTIVSPYSVRKTLCMLKRPWDYSAGWPFNFSTLAFLGSSAGWPFNFSTSVFLGKVQSSLIKFTRAAIEVALFVWNGVFWLLMTQNHRKNRLFFLAYGLILR